MNKYIDVDQLVDLQKKQTENWHNIPPAVSAQGFYAIVEKNHMYNYLLWHEEDKARRDDLGFEYVYNAKRNIDHFNQQRNNCMESMDEWVNDSFQPSQNGVPCNSETPGMIIDRLSIISLKAYHMQLQVDRTDVNPLHRQNCQQKLNIIHLQWRQLIVCLKEFLAEIANGTRSFRIYHQFKMYNDPELNPQLYGIKDASE